MDVLVFDSWHLQHPKKNTQLQKRYKKYALVTFDYRVACLCITKRHGLLQVLGSPAGMQDLDLVEGDDLLTLPGFITFPGSPIPDQTLTLCRTRESCYCWGPLYMGPPQARSLFVFTCSKRDQIKGQAFEGCCDFLTAPRSASRVHSNPSSKRRKRRKKNRSGCGWEECNLQLTMWTFQHEVGSVQADCRELICLSCGKAVNPHSIGFLFEEMLPSMIDALHWGHSHLLEPPTETPNQTTNDAKLHVTVYRILRASTTTKVASTVALAEWFARHEDLHMNIWRSMPIWLVQTKRSHWSTWQGKLHSSRSSNVNCCYGHSRGIKGEGHILRV